MRVDHHDGQTAFLEALSALLAVCDTLDDTKMLAASRCHGWTVGDVIAHVHLGLQEMLLGLVSPTDAEPDTDAAGYWQGRLPGTGNEAERIGQIQYVRRLTSAYRRPTGLLGHLRPTADAVSRMVSALPPTTVRFQGKILASGDFLATWAVEVAVHHLDLKHELTLPPPAPTALKLARTTVESLAGAPILPALDDEVVVLAGTGRVPLTDFQRRTAGRFAARLPVFG
ncbi:maleylpyruvate isomerase N-terminal domain-containing protein [Crossiella cryophila]|uniref:Uncharacterized protein (TIGR03083 family) n=1 Tax=Crossiella cryophila TaxID=43355 RepID=A0A7W7CDP2_9PSEU|nr:maleylpyruvate isomerase N-terminal domain-containing protein [Crossiella cryophila]MBB4677898.1 uncharacterized protein (TIGR03083 family) [Crossiella cryophila]